MTSIGDTPRTTSIETTTISGLADNGISSIITVTAGFDKLTATSTSTSPTGSAGAGSSSDNNGDSSAPRVQGAAMAGLVAIIGGIALL